MNSRIHLAALCALALSGAGATAAAAADPDHGKSLFEERCTLCHQLETAGQGPPLQGVVGRKAGAVKDFAYTDAMKSAGFAWTPEKLDAYLTSPREVVPGTAMIQSIPDPDERADLIAFLAAHK